jgi:hypothetical protein
MAAEKGAAECEAACNEKAGEIDGKKSEQRLHQHASGRGMTELALPRIKRPAYIALPRKRRGRTGYLSSRKLPRGEVSAVARGSGGGGRSAADAPAGTTKPWLD